MIVAKVADEENGLEAVVSQIGAARFSVAVRDVEADEYFPAVYIFGTLDAAMNKAGEIKPVGAVA